MSQIEFTALEKFLINREVPLLFKCNFIQVKFVSVIEASAVNVAIIYKNHALIFTQVFSH